MPSTPSTQSIDRCDVVFLVRACGSVAATGEHVLPLSVVKLGFVLKGHEFLVDHPDESLSLSVEDQELARYDELKGTLSLLVNHVGAWMRVLACLYVYVNFLVSGSS